ncbi:MAG TPA: pseudouridine synthase [Burkholderiales bacterium]
MQVVLFNKPYGVLCQFSPGGGKPTLKDFIPIPDVYPAGRLDTDSEGLLVLTDDGELQHAISHPDKKLRKVYWAQVEGEPDTSALKRLSAGVTIGGVPTLPCVARTIQEPANLWPRDPPIRLRKSIPTSWIEIELREGKNRQVRRMTAAIGFPTLRLVRVRVGDWSLETLAPGDFRVLAEEELSHSIKGRL